MKSRQFFLNWFVGVYALYCYFDRGIAYSYLAEITWLLGLLLITKRWRDFCFPWDKRGIVLVIMLAVTTLYMARGIWIQHYPAIDVVRDSFMFNYLYFIFIICLFRNELPQLKEKLYKVYQWFPLVLTVNLLLHTFAPVLGEFKLLGGVPLLEYRHGDLSVQLLVTTLLMLNGKIKARRQVLVLNWILMGYLFLVAATFSRGGMMAYLAGLIVFLWGGRKMPVVQQFFSYLKFMPLVLLVALPMYMGTKMKEQVHGRDIGVSQLKENVVSLVSSDKTKGNVLNDNVLWRLAWWGKIIDYTVFGPYFMQGKGLGVNLATDDSIGVEDESLRSPHNFHLNVLARFGVPFFLFWLYWLSLLLQPLFRKGLPVENLYWLSMIVAFLVNATFDVALEGPMAAFPCWTIAGIAYASEVFN